MTSNYRRLAIRVLVGAILALFAAVTTASAQAPPECYPPKKIRKNVFWTEGVQWGRTYTYGLVVLEGTLNADTVDGIRHAFTAWSNLNNEPNGSKASFVEIQGGGTPDIQIHIKLPPANQYGYFLCPTCTNGRAAGTMENFTTFTGKVTGGISR